MTEPRPTRSALSDVWFALTDLEVAQGAGAVVITTDGTEYLDLTSGIGVVNTGHSHPRIVEAIRHQAGRFVHAQLNCYRHDLLDPLATRLAEVTPTGIERFFLSNSGAEATEAAVKLAKQVTRRPHVVVFQGILPWPHPSDHGDDHLQDGVPGRSRTAARRGVRRPVPLPLRHRGGRGHGRRPRFREFDQLLRTQTAPDEVACAIIEPVLGEGGYVPAPARFLHGLRDRCRAHGILFVADEVQTGFGRTGRLFAVEHHDLFPDVLVMAKGIASGFPLSTVGASEDLMERWPTGSHGGTYGGNPMGCAAALATLDVMTDPGLLPHARAIGARFRSGLDALASTHEGIGENRNLGPMLATEIASASPTPVSLGKPSVSCPDSRSRSTTPHAVAGPLLDRC